MNAQVLKKYRLDEVEQLVEQKARPIVLYFYTDWCQYCKMMEKITFRNKEIIALLNSSYYFVEINAEDKEEIFHLKKTFKYLPSGIHTGTNEIVDFYLKPNQRIYPSILLLNVKFERKTLLQSYLNPTGFRRFLLP